MIRPGSIPWQSSESTSTSGAIPGLGTSMSPSSSTRPRTRRGGPLTLAGHGRGTLEEDPQHLAAGPPGHAAGRDRSRGRGRFFGFKTAATEQPPDTVAVLDPFPVIQLSGDALDRCRQRVQQQTLGRRGRKRDLLYGGSPDSAHRRGTAHRKETGTIRCGVRRRGTRRGQSDLTDVPADDRRLPGPGRAAGRAALAGLIAKGTKALEESLVELKKMAGTSKSRAEDVLTYFNRPRTSNGPTYAMNGRLEHLRGSALGFRNLTNYVPRSLLETGGFRPLLHPGVRSAPYQRNCVGRLHIVDTGLFGTPKKHAFAP